MTGFAYAGAEVGIGVVLTKASEQGRVLWRLAEPVVYELQLKDGQVLRFELPAGAATDGASVPCWLTWLVKVVEYPTFLPSALHDHLWDQHQAEKAASAPPSWSRASTSITYSERRCGRRALGRPKRWAMWSAVRLQAWWTR